MAEMLGHERVQAAARCAGEGPPSPACESNTASGSCTAPLPPALPCGIGGKGALLRIPVGSGAVALGGCPDVFNMPLSSPASPHARCMGAGSNGPVHKASTGSSGDSHNPSPMFKPATDSPDCIPGNVGHSHRGPHASIPGAATDGTAMTATGAGGVATASSEQPGYGGQRRLTGDAAQSQLIEHHLASRAQGAGQSQPQLMLQCETLQHQQLFQRHALPPGAAAVPSPLLSSATAGGSSATQHAGMATNPSFRPGAQEADGPSLPHNMLPSAVNTYTPLTSAPVYAGTPPYSGVATVVGDNHAAPAALAPAEYSQYCSLAAQQRLLRSQLDDLQAQERQLLQRQASITIAGAGSIAVGLGTATQTGVDGAAAAAPGHDGSAFDIQMLAAWHSFTEDCEMRVGTPPAMELQQHMSGALASLPQQQQQQQQQPQHAAPSSPGLVDSCDTEGAGQHREVRAVVCDMVDMLVTMETHGCSSSSARLQVPAPGGGTTNAPAAGGPLLFEDELTSSGDNEHGGEVPDDLLGWSPAGGGHGNAGHTVGITDSCSPIISACRLHQEETAAAAARQGTWPVSAPVAGSSESLATAAGSTQHHAPAHAPAAPALGGMLLDALDDFAGEPLSPNGAMMLDDLLELASPTRPCAAVPPAAAYAGMSAPSLCGLVGTSAALQAAVQHGSALEGPSCGGFASPRGLHQHRSMPVGGHQGLWHVPARPPVTTAAHGGQHLGANAVHVVSTYQHAAVHRGHHGGPLPLAQQLSGGSMQYGSSVRSDIMHSMGSCPPNVTQLGGHALHIRQQTQPGMNAMLDLHMDGLLPSHGNPASRGIVTTASPSLQLHHTARPPHVVAGQLQPQLLDTPFCSAAALAQQDGCVSPYVPAAYSGHAQGLHPMAMTGHVPLGLQRVASAPLTPGGSAGVLHPADAHMPRLVCSPSLPQALPDNGCRRARSSSSTGGATLMTVSTSMAAPEVDAGSDADVTVGGVPIGPDGTVLPATACVGLSSMVGPINPAVVGHDAQVRVEVKWQPQKLPRGRGRPPSRAREAARAVNLVPVAVVTAILTGPKATTAPPDASWSAPTAMQGSSIGGSCEGGNGLQRKRSGLLSGLEVLKPVKSLKLERSSSFKGMSGGNNSSDRPASSNTSNGSSASGSGPQCGPLQRKRSGAVPLPRASSASVLLPGMEVSARGKPTFADLVTARAFPTGTYEFSVGTVQSVTASVSSNGSITLGDDVYQSISSFALAAARSRNPGRQACDGWKEVRLQGIKLEVWRQAFMDKQPPPPIPPACIRG